MPPRNPELPEGTDHIINGAMETGAGSGASTGSSGGTGSGFIGSGDTGGLGDDTGGTAGGLSSGGGASYGGSSGSASGSGASGSSGGGQGGSAVSQLKDGATSLKSQASDKVRAYAEDGKSRATTALDDLSQVVGEAASSIDERLGSEYGQYARRAADAVSGLADSLRGKNVDELFESGRTLIRKSPVVAIGAAAAVGFALVRLIKSGLSSQDEGDVDVRFTPDSGTGTQGGASGTGTGTTPGSGA